MPDSVNSLIGRARKAIGLDRADGSDSPVIKFLLRFQSIIGFILLFIIACFVCVKDGRNNFLAVNNLMNVLRAVSENGIIAIGMTMVILLGGVDLSVGAVIALVGTGAATMMMQWHWGFLLTVLLSLLIGAAFGFFNGTVITRMRMQPFLVTLASMNIARGLARMWSNGSGVPLSYTPGNAPVEFSYLAERLFGVVPVPAIIFIVLTAIFAWVLKFTRFGRQVYATGGNKRAAHLAGINVKRITLAVFMLSAMLAAVAGMIHAAQTTQGGPNDGMGYELNAIAAVCIGGTSLAGGKGTVFGTCIGALILGLLDNIMGLNAVDSNIQLIVKGLIVIMAVFMQAGKPTDE